MWDFPEPVGRLPVTHHSHEEIYSMPATFKGVKDIDFKYYLMYQPAIFYAMGLCSQDKVKVGDAEVAPIDVVTAMVPLLRTTYSELPTRNWSMPTRRLS